MRGEHMEEGDGRNQALGSSPHARGALLLSRNTQTSFGDHPRMRGEHGTTLKAGTTLPGSSPHARGAHLNTCGFAQDSSESH